MYFYLSSNSANLNSNNMLISQILTILMLKTELYTVYFVKKRLLCIIRTSKFWVEARCS